MQTNGGPVITTREAFSPVALVRRIGPHPAVLLELDLDSGEDAALGGWLLASCLLDARTPETRGLEAWRSLQKQGLDAPDTLEPDAVEVVTGCFKEAGLSRPDRLAPMLIRLATSLRRDYAGSLDRLASAADGLEDLASRLARLAPGFGQARVARFLRPLRDRWTAVDELPLDRAALAAAVHLGYAEPDLDPESGPSRLRQALESFATHSASGTPPLRDFEAALERLGRASCVRNRVEQCPLASDCPARDESHTSSC
jgi:endonuclease III